MPVEGRALRWKERIMAGYLWTCWSILASAVATAVLYTAVYRLSASEDDGACRADRLVKPAIVGFWRLDCW